MLILAKQTPSFIVQIRSFKLLHFEDIVQSKSVSEHFILLEEGAQEEIRLVKALFSHRRNDLLNRALLKAFTPIEYVPET